MISIQKFGTLASGHDIHAYRLCAPNKMTATLINYGATLQALCLPDGQDIVLGFDTLERYVAPHPYFGTAVGRVANRIKGGKFKIDGHNFSVSQNEGENALHGGPNGFDKKVWDTVVGNASVTFHHTSPDGNQGYPGALKTSFRYTLDDEGLRLDMVAESTAPTLVNLTGHSYFNLGDNVIDNHALSISAQSFFENATDNVNTGRIQAIENTELDFLASRKIAGTQIDRHFNVAGTNMRKMATLFSPLGDKRLTILSDLPGMQIYTGDAIGEHKGKTEQRYHNRSGIAFEPQYPPNAINLPNMPNTILRPGTLGTQYYL